MRESEIDFKKSLKGWQQVYHQVFFFMLSFLVIDSLLMVSQVFQLQWETHIFEALLTQFNLMLALIFVYEETFIYYLAYYLSGSFLLVNYLIRWSLNCQLLTLTFSLNFIICTFMIKEFVLSRKLAFLGGYAVYFLIFANFDGILDFDLRWIMLVPLVISLSLFLKFMKEIHYFFFITVSRHKPRFHFSTIVFKIIDFGVFMITSLPLYWTFASKDCFKITLLALFYHGFSVVYYIAFGTRITFNQLQQFNNLSYRLTQNSFNLTVKGVAFKTDQRKWQQQTCGKCTLRPANVLFLQCGHLAVCRDCWKAEKSKKSFKLCFLCGEQVYISTYLEKSYGEMVERELLKTQSQLWNMYLISSEDVSEREESRDEQQSQL